jgi:hypothetical protein
MPGYGRRQTWGRIYLVLSLLLRLGFRDWVALLTGRLWLVTQVRHYRKLFKTQGGDSRDIVEDCGRGGGGWVRNAQGHHTEGGRVEGGSKLKLEGSDFPANGTVGLLSEIVLTLFRT